MAPLAVCLPPYIVFCAVNVDNSVWRSVTSALIAKHRAFRMAPWLGELLLAPSAISTIGAQPRAARERFRDFAFREARVDCSAFGRQPDRPASVQSDARTLGTRLDRAHQNVLGVCLGDVVADMRLVNYRIAEEPPLHGPDCSAPALTAIAQPSELSVPRPCRAASRCQAADSATVRWDTSSQSPSLARYTRMNQTEYSDLPAFKNGAFSFTWM